MKKWYLHLDVDKVCFSGSRLMIMIWMIERFTGSSEREGVYMLERDLLARPVRNGDMYE